jgi:hypothetical protein
MEVLFAVSFLVGVVIIVCSLRLRGCLYWLAWVLVGMALTALVLWGLPLVLHR